MFCPLAGAKWTISKESKSVVACTCNSATLEAEFRNGVGSILAEGNSPSIGGWIVWAPVIQHKERSLTKYWNLTETQQ